MNLEIKPGRRCLILPPQRQYFPADICTALELVPPMVSLATGQLVSDIWLIDIEGKRVQKCSDPYCTGDHPMACRAPYLMPLPDDDESLKLFGKRDLGVAA